MSDLPTRTPITDPQNPTPTAVPAENAYALTYPGKHIHGTGNRRTGTPLRASDRLHHPEG